MNYETVLRDLNNMCIVLSDFLSATGDVTVQISKTFGKLNISEIEL